MIRKNVASQVIYLPQLRLTADGSAVTSSATIVVSKDGTEAASAGTLTHYAGGVWKYVPTQGETNCAIVGLILTATGADTVVLNLVTTGADTSAVAFGAMASYTQPTGFLAASFPTDPADQSLVIAATDAILTQVNLRSTQASVDALPTAAAIANEVQTRTIARVTLVDTCTTNIDMRGTNNAMLAASYTPPDNTSITAIRAYTNQLQTDWVDGGRLDLILDEVHADVDEIPSRVWSVDISGLWIADTAAGHVKSILSALTALATKFNGISLIADWLRRAFRKDAGTAGMVTAQSEINTGGTATFSGLTDSLEAIRDASSGGGGSATLENQELILEQLDEIQTSISSVTITTTGFGQISPDGTLLLKRGHTATITFTSDTSNIVSDLSGGTTKVFLGIRDTAGRQWLSVEGTVVTATGLQAVSFTIPAAKAAALVLGVHRFDVIAVYGYAAGSPPTYTSLEPFASGNVTVHELSLDLTNI